MTPQQVKAKFQEQGVSIAQWSEQNGVNRDIVYRILNGRSVGLRGKTHHVDRGSFGFRFGIPLESDLVFDVRFLPNPYFVPALKPFTGLDRNVSTFVLDKPETGEFLKRLKEMLQFMLPLYQKEGKSYLTVSIGCTGGKHRSVAMAEDLRDRLTAAGLAVSVMHRDLGRE